VLPSAAVISKKPPKNVAKTIPAQAKTPARKPQGLKAATATAQAHAEAARALPVAPPRPPRLLQVKPKPRPPVRAVAGTVVGPAAVDPYAGVDTGASSDQALVEQLLAPQYAQIDMVAERQARADAQRAALIQGITQQMTSQVSGIPDAVGSDYDHMIAQTTGMADKAAAGLAAANPNADTQAMLDAVGAPAEQKTQVGDLNRNVYQGGAALLSGTQGFLPGETLAKVGLAQKTYARSLPAVIGAQGLQALRQFLYESDQARQTLSDQRLQVASGAPKLLYDIQTQNQANAFKQQQLDFEQALAAKQYGLKVKDLGLKVQNQQFQQGATVTRLQQGQQSLALRALQSDRSWQATLKRLGIAEAGLSLRAATAQAKLNGGGFTTSQKLGLQKRAGAIANDAFNGVAVKEKGSIVGYNHTTYQHAISDMLAQGIPLTVAQNALNTYWSRPGLTMPWEYDANGGRLPGAGRPLLSYQQRQQQTKRKKK
jgi:hypothetical protein